MFWTNQERLPEAPAWKKQVPGRQPLESGPDSTTVKGPCSSSIHRSSVASKEKTNLDCCSHAAFSDSPKRHRSLSHNASRPDLLHSACLVARLSRTFLLLHAPLTPLRAASRAPGNRAPRANTHKTTCKENQPTSIRGKVNSHRAQLPQSNRRPPTEATTTFDRLCVELSSQVTTGPDCDPPHHSPSLLISCTRAPASPLGVRHDVNPQPTAILRRFHLDNRSALEPVTFPSGEQHGGKLRH